LRSAESRAAVSACARSSASFRRELFRRDGDDERGRGIGARRFRRRPGFAAAALGDDARALRLGLFQFCRGCGSFLRRGGRLFHRRSRRCRAEIQVDDVAQLVGDRTVHLAHRGNAFLNASTTSGS